MPDPHVFTKLLLINRSSKSLQTRLPSKRLPAETSQLRTQRRNVDIESKKRHGELKQVKARYRNAGVQRLSIYRFDPFTMKFWTSDT
jgi:hypothetical protein